MIWTNKTIERSRHQRSPTRSHGQVAKQRGGFTLVELLVVLTIMGLLTATVVLRLGGVAHRGQLRWAIERFTATDAALRSYTVANRQPSQLKLEIGTSRLTRAFGEKLAATTTIDLGRSVTVDRFLSPTREVTSGTVTIDYSPQGVSETFTVVLKTPSESQTWLVVAGLTGQITELQEESRVRRLLRTIRSSGRHAR